MADISTGQRTYFIGLSATTVTTTSNIAVPFKDTSGNVIKCNYFKIDAINNSTTQVGLVQAEPSGITAFRLHKDLPTVSAIYNTTSIPPSGTIGVGIVLGGGSTGSAEWHAQDGDVCTGVNLKLVAQNSTMIIGITYGNLIPYNSIRALPVRGADGGRGSSYDIGV